MRDGGGAAADVDLWTTCFTPRELRLLCSAVGLTVESLGAAEPGDWSLRPPDTESPEFLVIACARATVRVHGPQRRTA